MQKKLHVQDSQQEMHSGEVFARKIQRLNNLIMCNTQNLHAEK